MRISKICYNSYLFKKQWLLTQNPKDIIPIPKMTAVIKCVLRNRGKTEILTNSPYKNKRFEQSKCAKNTVSKFNLNLNLI